jgi:heavy metal sensor kinase
MRLGSIRFRLTAWYGGVLLAGLILFGFGSWFAMRRSLYQSVDHELRDHLRDVKGFMDLEMAKLSPAEIIEEFGEHAALGPDGELYQVRDGAGNWLYRSPRLTIPVAEVSGDEVQFVNVAQQGRIFRVASTRVVVSGKQYAVDIAISMSEMLESLDRFRNLLLMLIPILVAGALGGGYWVSRRALGPVDEITRAARSISIQNLSDRLTVAQSGDELQRLSETVNGMLARLELSVSRMKQFTADASHELRAPVAVIRTTAELTLRKDRSPDEYRGALREVLVESERTSQLVDSLLMLARADSGADQLTLRPIDVAACVREACEEGTKLAESHRIQFDYQIPPEAVNIQGDAPAVRRLFFSLIDNAIKYTPEGGRVHVELHAHNGFVAGEVGDDGIGIAGDDLPYVFDRFWRADKARSREAGGAGLGLSIARWIAERHGGAIEVESALGRGSTFRVKLPVSSSAN